MVLRWSTAAVVAAAFIVFDPGPVGAQPDFTLEATEGSGIAGEAITIPILLDNPLHAAEAWWFGLCHDASVAAVTSVVAGPSYDSATFHEVEIFSNGFTVGTIVEFPTGPPLPPGSDQVIEVVTYTVAGPGSTSLDFCDHLGSPPVFTLVIHTGLSIVPTKVSGLITGLTEHAFRRADCNADGVFDLADTIFLEQYLFISGPVPPCLNACDMNNDGVIDIADPIFWLMYLFLMGSPPAEPFAICGADPDPIPCDAPCP
jgi:hypothetical protein